MTYYCMKIVNPEDIDELIVNKYDIEINSLEELVNWKDYCSNGSYLPFDLKWMWEDEEEKAFLKENFPERYLILEALVEEFPDEEEILIGIFY